MKYLLCLLTYVAAYENFYTALPKLTDWEKYKNSPPLERVDLEEIFLQNIAPYLMAPPLTPVNTTCKPYPLPEITQGMCLQEPHVGFTGLRKAPVKVAHHFYFGYDVDLLEVHFQENADVVDYFFITEALHAHRHSPRLRRKPLIWDRIKFDSRFRPFLHKVVHFIVDEGNVPKLNVMGQWGMEHLQPRIGWEQFLKWNAVTKYFGPDDLMIMGMADEIPYRGTINLLKHCAFTGQVDIGSMMYMCSLNNVFRSDFSVKGYPYTLGDPTVFRLGDINGVPGVARGKSPHFILGGSHIATNKYLPHVLVKEIAATEAFNSIDYHDRLRPENIHQFANHMATLCPFGDRMVPTVSVYCTHERAIRIPWFMTCNPDRFAIWFSKPDPRLDVEFNITF